MKKRTEIESTTKELEKNIRELDKRAQRAHRKADELHQEIDKLHEVGQPKPAKKQKSGPPLLTSANLLRISR